MNLPKLSWFTHAPSVPVCVIADQQRAHQHLMEAIIEPGQNRHFENGLQNTMTWLEMGNIGKPCLKKNIPSGYFT